MLNLDRPPGESSPLFTPLVPLTPFTPCDPSPAFVATFTVVAAAAACDVCDGSGSGKVGDTLPLPLPLPLLSAPALAAAAADSDSDSDSGGGRAMLEVGLNGSSMGDSEICTSDSAAAAISSSSSSSSSSSLPIPPALPSEDPGWWSVCAWLPSAELVLELECRLELAVVGGGHIPIAVLPLR